MSAEDTERLVQAKRTKGKLTPLETTLQVVQTAALPVAVGAYLIRRWLKHRKAQKGKPKAPSAAAAAAAAATAAAAARRESAKSRKQYKVKRDEVGQMLATDDGDAYPDIQPGDDTMEVYNEDEVDSAGAAATGGAPNNQMIEMLKSMGFRMVVDKQSGQIYMVPPGAKAPNEQDGIAEGDEEGEDEDEDEE